MTSLEEVPTDLMKAIGQAFRILDWYEELSEEEQPPEWMWPFEEELEEWFDEVKAAREAKYGGGGDQSTDDIEVPMMINEYAGGRR